MNVVARYLEDHRDRLALDALGLPRLPGYLVITPRFALSRHVVFLVLDGQRPVVVAKLPRAAGDCGALAREAANLRAAGRASAATSGVAPRLLCFDDRPPHPVLLETALVGRALSPAAVRRDAGNVVPLVATWLAELARRTARPAAAGWYAELVRAPLERLAPTRASDRALTALVARTLELTSPLASATLPTVLEHGDLAHPNLIALPDGRVGVLDWETGTPHGLPGADLVFFLGFVAGAIGQRRVRSGDPTGGAFSSPGGWAWPTITSYTRALGLARVLLVPLVVAGAARSVAIQADREGGGDATAAVGRLLQSRAGTLWKHVVAHADDLPARVDALHRDGR